MANKPIISIDVNDQQFKSFYDLFGKYKSDLSEMPKSWADVDKAVAKAAKSLNSHSWSKEDFKVMAREMEKAADAQKKFHLLSLESSLHMKKMSDSAKTLSSSIFDIGKWMLKLGALGGGIAGLGGILSAISLRDLAHAAVTDQRGARGVGLTPGQYKAFGMDFGRFLDPSILSNVANAQNSYQGRVWLGLATGLGQDAVTNQGADQISMRLAMRAHDWWVNTPASQRTSENLMATGFSQSGLTLDDMRRLGNTPLSELQSARSQFNQDKSTLDVSNKTTQAWYEFDRQITLAGKTIETAFTNRLVELAPSLRGFVDVLTKDATILINDIFTPKNLKVLEDGIDSLTQYLGSPAFRQDLRDFAAGIADIAGAIRKIGHFVSRGAPSDSTSTKQDAWDALGPGAVDRIAGKVQSIGGEPSYFASMEKAHGLPRGLMYAQEMVESRGHIGAISPAGARGPFQFMRKTAEQYGLTDPFNLHDSADANSRMMGDLMGHYKNDVRKALAAYNWGIGNVDKDISANGSQWESKLPAETRAYISKVAEKLAKGTTVNVKVDVKNSTSARVAVQANAASAGM
ncbi:lytic transglycosylase domain-containing protein [Burkholderia plantarii]|uniref:lytic transglycosylase domain-containing protein n=1 Tax=Burkholderia plantarii TaxID=41899 RepID=UPI000870926E|nr:lytic transglycosylase domain-containing protein [Burkholderia plantarii]